MSLKPPKKSDAKKSWMKARQGKAKRLQPEYHLIITEGTTTEPAYFTAIRDEINSQYRGKIHLDISGEGDNTINLFQRALQEAHLNPNRYRHVWIVYDTDDFPAENVNKVVDLCKEHSTEETTYHAIWSNQCIELWYLLHFSFMQSNLHRNEYYPKLTNYLTSIQQNSYQKNRTDMYFILKPYMDIAIANAKKLSYINKDKLPSNSTPGTMVYILIEKLKPYL